jgi:spermidine/putrescine transport system substrate-binding protein
MGKWARGLTLMVLLAILVACGAPAAPPSPTTPPTPPPTAPATEAPPATGPAAAEDSCGDRSRLSKQLYLFNWPDYIAQEVLERFERECGVKVIVDTYDSNETLLAKLQAGATGYDVIVPSDYMVSIMIKEGMLAELDKNNLPNLKHIDPAHLGLYFDPENKYTVPYMWGTSGFMYDTAAVQRELKSWKDLFEPAPDIQGKISMLKDEREVIGAALKYLGFSMNTTNPEELQKAKEVLLRQKPYVKAYTSDTNRDLLVAGEVVVAHIWTGDAIRARDAKPTLKYVIPEEGCTIWQDNLAIPKTSKNKYTAEVFINFLMRPDIAAINANTIKFGSTNRTAIQQRLIDPALLNDPGIYPPDELKRKMEWMIDVGDAIELYDRIWTELGVEQ